MHARPFILIFLARHHAWKNRLGRRAELRVADRGCCGVNPQRRDGWFSLSQPCMCVWKKHRREEEHLKRANQGSLALFCLLLNLFPFPLPPSSPHPSNLLSPRHLFSTQLLSQSDSSASALLTPPPSSPPPFFSSPLLHPKMCVLVYSLAYIPLLCLSPHIIPRQVRLLSHRQGVSWFPSLFSSSPPPLFLHAIHFQSSASLPLIPSSLIAGPCKEH